MSSLVQVCARVICVRTVERVCWCVCFVIFLNIGRLLGQVGYFLVCLTLIISKQGRAGWHSLWSVPFSRVQPVSGNLIGKIDSEIGTNGACHLFLVLLSDFSNLVSRSRSRIGPETNVYIGIARARTCQRTTIDDRLCVSGSASVVYLFISPLQVIFWFVIRKTRAQI